MNTESVTQILRAMPLAALIEETAETDYSVADLLDDLACAGLRLEIAKGKETSNAYLAYLKMSNSGMTDQEFVAAHVGNVDHE